MASKIGVRPAVLEKSRLAILNCTEVVMVVVDGYVKSAKVPPTPYAYYPPAAKGKDKTLSIIISDLFRGL